MLYTEQRCAEKNTTVLVAAKSRSLRDALQAILTLMPRIGTISQTGDVSSTLKSIIDLNPALVLLDTSLRGGEISSLVRTVKAGGPESRCLVLADDVRQQQEAQAAGADVALLKGFPADKLFDVIDDLVDGPEKVS